MKKNHNNIWLKQLSEWLNIWNLEILDSNELLKFKKRLLKIIESWNNWGIELQEIINIIRNTFINSIISIQDLSKLNNSEIKWIHLISQKLNTPLNNKNETKNNKINKMIYDTWKERANYDWNPKICEIDWIKYFIFWNKSEDVVIVKKKIWNIYETVSPINNNCILFDENSWETLWIENTLIKNNDIYFIKKPIKSNFNRCNFILFNIIEWLWICELLNKTKDWNLIKHNKTYYLYNSKTWESEILKESNIKWFFLTNQKNGYYKIYDINHDKIHKNIKSDFSIFNHWNANFVFNWKKLIFLSLNDCSIECKSFEIAKTENWRNILIIRFKNWNSSIFNCDSINNNFDGFFIITDKKIQLKEKDFSLKPRLIPDKIKVEWKIRKIKLN